MKPEVIPDWVPEAVKLTAIGMQNDNERIRRFVTDERMRHVWTFLLRQNVNEHGFAAVPYADSLKSCDVDQFSFSVPERGCAALYLATLEVSVAGDYSITRSLLEDAGRIYKETIENCNWLMTGDHFPVLGLGDEVKRALELVAQHCHDRWRFLVQDGNPRRLELSSGDRNDDAVRGHVRKLSVSTQALYGSILAGTLSNIANVVFQPKKVITAQTVRNWCKNVPSQSGH